MTAAPPDPARSAGIMLLVASVLILIGLISKNWVSFGDGQIHVGPMGVEMCGSGMCVDVPGDKGMPGDISLVRVLAMIAGFASVGAAGLFGGMTLAGKRDRLPAPKLANVAFGLAAFSFVYFVIRVLIE